MKHIAGVVCLSLISFLACAQKEAGLEEYKKRFPDKQAVMLVKREVVKIALGKNDSLDISLNYYSEMLHLGERTEGLAESSVSYSDFIHLSDLEAKTLVPAKSNYKTVKVSDFKTKSSSSGGIFFDDSQSKIFTYPGVQPGAKTVLSYTQKFKEPRLLVPYYFNFYVPVIESEIVLMVDKRIRINHRLFNNKDSRIKFTESPEGNFNVYKWTGSDMPEYTLESNSPNVSYHEPHLIYFIGEVLGKERKENIFGEVKDLYKWYYSLAIKNQKTAGPELRRIVDSLTKGVESPYEKTRKIFYWVQDHVKYVAFEEGYGGFIPRDATMVCDRRFGDCKDMANLLVQMLNEAGVKAYHTWIGTRDIPYTYSELPATNVDNHMIAAVKLDDKFVFLDATGRYTTLGYPTSMIQGKEALIGIDENHFEIVKVPVMEPSKNLVTDTTWCKIDEGNVLTGSGKIDVTGYNKIDLTYVINYTKKEDLKEMIKGYCTKGSNKFLLTSYTMQNLDDKDKPLKIAYDFRLDDYVKATGNEMYINLNMDRPYDKDRIDTVKRKLPVEHEHKFIQHDVIVMEVPKGYKVDYLPSGSSEKSPELEFEITYKKVGDSKIIYTKKVILNTLLVKQPDFDEWNKITHKLSQAYREVVVLKRN